MVIRRSFLNTNFPPRTVFWTLPQGITLQVSCLYTRLVNSKGIRLGFGEWGVLQTDKRLILNVGRWLVADPVGGMRIAAEGQRDSVLSGRGTW
jgi:hypothetical protein